MWRPFASDFVGHTYDDFRKKYDKVWAIKPIQSKPVGDKFDPKGLYPYKLGVEELVRRQDEFITLRLKVAEQRKRIKQRDQSFSNNQKVKVILQKEESQVQRKNEKKTMQRIRSMASNKARRYRSTISQDFYDSNTFPLTSLDRSQITRKNRPLESKVNSTVTFTKTASNLGKDFSSNIN